MKALKRLLIFAGLALLVYVGVRLVQIGAEFPFWIVPVLPFALIFWLWSMGARTRKMSESLPRNAFVEARGVIRRVQIVNAPAPADRVAVRLYANVEDPLQKKVWTTWIDASVPLSAMGHFGENSIIRVQYHPQSPLATMQLCGDVPLDR